MENNRQNLNCFIFFLFIGFTYSLQGNAQKNYDVFVYGGTAAGLTAAIQTAKMGLSVALIEQGSHIGGMSVEGLGGTDIDNHKEFQNSSAVGGMALEFYRRISDAYNRRDAFDSMIRYKIKNPSLWRFESSIAEKVIQKWLSEYKIDIYYKTRLREEKPNVIKKGASITKVFMEENKIFSSKIFIDATIEGDLLNAAGITTTAGREPNALYNETLNGIRAETNHAQFAVKVDAYQIPGNSSSGVIATIQDEPLGQPGEGDKNVQAYCFRMCLTKDKNNQMPFTSPINYNRDDYEIYLRYEKAGGKLYTPGVNLPNGKTDLGAWHDLSHNLHEMNREYPEGNYATRKKVLDHHRHFTQGLFYFLSNDTANSKAIRDEWARWGLCKDEFTDNEGWPRMFYVRDERRMVSDFVITQHHGSRDNPTPVKDPVAVAFWPMDVHSVRRIVKDGYAYNEGFIFGGNYWRPFGVSYRAMVPPKKECVNLLTPTCLSSSHIAYGAIRLEYNYMLQGQACGIAAKLAIKKNKNVQAVSYKKLKKLLLKEGAILNASDVGGQNFYNQSETH